MPQQPDRYSWSSPLDPVVVTTEIVASGKSEVLLVTHEEGNGGWRLHDGSGVANQRQRSWRPVRFVSSWLT